MKTKMETISSQASRLFEESKKVVAESGLSETEDLLERIPDSLFPSKDKKLSVVFAGQYSAGKSSLIKILTGRNDIKVGGGITTQKAVVYEWNNIEVVDTPGISTEHIKEHDIEAKNAISQADLLVYMLTRKGFDDFLARDFQEIAIDLGKSHEMMLVINKMKNTAEGNTPEQQQIVFENNIFPACQPRTAESLYTTFMDIQSYYRSLDPQFEKYRERLLADSGLESFYQNFDRFMQEKGHIGTMTTQLYSLYQVLSDALERFVDSGSIEDATIHLLMKKSRLLNDAILEIKEWYESHSSKLSASILSMREEIIDKCEEDGYEMVNDYFKKQQDKLPELYASFEKEMTNYVDNRIQVLQDQIGSMLSDSFAVNLKQQIKHLQEHDLPLEKLGGIVSGKKLDEKDRLDGLSKGIDEGLGKLTEHKKAIHDYILKKGHKNGRKFKPHEVNKETDKFIGKVNKIGKYGKVALIVIGVGIEIYNEIKDYKTAEAIKAIKAQIRSFFELEAKDGIDQYRIAINDYLDNELQPLSKECSERIHEIRKNMQDVQNSRTRLMELMEGTNDLIDMIHTEE